MMLFGGRIATLRDKYELTQAELAEKLGISRAALSHYEKNRREPDVQILTKIADYFHVTVDYLIGRTNLPHTNLDMEVKQFVDDLELSDEELLTKFTLTVDGRKLTEEEARRFIAFVRAERTMNVH